MTYYPIDKPTEPGTYWYEDCRGEFVAMNVYRYDGILKADISTTVDQCRGQWFGPAIEPPQCSDRQRALDELTALSQDLGLYDLE
jgi:hypothetical protein